MTDELHFWQLIMNGLLLFAYTTMESVSGSYMTKSKMYKTIRR